LKFILGTATFGNSYGVANEKLNFKYQDLENLMIAAQELGIQTIDTAPAYGPAEKVVGRFHSYNRKFAVHTKVSNHPNLSRSDVVNSIDQSILNLYVDKIDVLYFHSADFLINESQETVKQLLKAIKGTGLVSRIGASVYTEEEIKKISKLWKEIEVFQVPENIMDQRLLNSSLLPKLASSGIAIHVRSIFLQGLLLMENSKIPQNLLSSKSYLLELQNYAHELQMSVLDVCINYLSKLTWASDFLIGATTPSHLADIVNYQQADFMEVPLPKPLPIELIDPRRW
jgi:aryl-alcohol dehydrogenase-like predicted oxidoreductase